MKDSRNSSRPALDASKGEVADGLLRRRVMLEHGTHPRAAVSDINQKGTYASKERIETEWAESLRIAGLERSGRYLISGLNSTLDP